MTPRQFMSYRFGSFSCLPSRKLLQSSSKRPSLPASPSSSSFRPLDVEVGKGMSKVHLMKGLKLHARQNILASPRMHQLENKKHDVKHDAVCISHFSRCWATHSVLRRALMYRGCPPGSVPPWPGRHENRAPTRAVLLCSCGSRRVVYE